MILDVLNRIHTLKVRIIHLRYLPTSESFTAEQKKTNMQSLLDNLEILRQEYDGWFSAFSFCLSFFLCLSICVTTAPFVRC
jgi:hypothetical protein